MEEIEKARELLQRNGYYTDNLWHIHDVKSQFDCDDKTAYQILDFALTNEGTYDQIWFSIKEGIRIINQNQTK